MKEFSALTPLSDVLGQKFADLLEKELGVLTLVDLLSITARSYLELGERSDLGSLPIDAEVSFVAEVSALSTRRMHSRKGSITEVSVTDGQQLLTFSLFGHPKAHPGLETGALGLLSGKTALYRGRLTLNNPKFFPLEREEDAQRQGAVPIYPATAKVPSRVIEGAIAQVFQALGFPQDPVSASAVSAQLQEGDSMAWEQTLEDPIPSPLLASRKLCSLARAYALVHRPMHPADAREGLKRLRWQEAFVLQTALAKRRMQARSRQTKARRPRKGGLLDVFDASLPFQLTKGQRLCGEKISAAMSKDEPLNVLLQGDVGSGKTLVALRAMLQVVDAGAQTVLLAPTEVLATQHAQSLARLLGDLHDDGTLFTGVKHFKGNHSAGVRLTLLTGSMSSAEKQRALLEIASGTAGLVVGTHALLSEKVSFADLGLVVVDEQHRFGVEQRDALRERAEGAVHMMVMTATPIPRTVAMSVFGDLELLTLKGLPGGRGEILTHVVPLEEQPAWEARLWQRAREELDAGRQVFVVAPKISATLESAGEESAEEAMASDTSCASVEETSAWLKRESILGQHRVESLHSAMEAGKKAETMARFASGQTGVLVSTTVIEVGVDVPNASLMIILDAERFGISQLHQLRGRIGRGAHAGLCLLVTRFPAGHPSRERLDAVASTLDGFALAEADIAIRKEGDVLGSAQSGRRRSLRLLSLRRDAGVIEDAREAASELVGQDPDLEKHPGLGELIDSMLGEEKALYLDRS